MSVSTHVRDEYEKRLAIAMKLSVERNLLGCQPRVKVNVGTPGVIFLSFQVRERECEQKFRNTQVLKSHEEYVLFSEIKEERQ